MRNIILVLSILFIVGCGNSSESNTVSNNKNQIKNDPLNLPALDGVESPTKDIQHIK